MNRRRRPRSRLEWLAHQVRRDLRRHGGSLAAVAAALGIAALLLGAHRLTAHVTARLAGALRDGVHVVAYLRDDFDGRRVEALRRSLAKLPGIERTRVVGSDEAMARLRARLGADGSLLDGVEDGFLPAAIEVALAPEPGIEARARDLVRRLERIEGVESVDGMGAGLDRVVGWLALGRIFGRALLLLAGIATLAVGVLAVRIGRQDRRVEAEILLFLGATPLGARAPAALAGALAAVAGATLGGGVLLAIFRIARASLEASASVRVPFLPVTEVIVGGILAALGGAVMGYRMARVPGSADG